MPSDFRALRLAAPQVLKRRPENPRIAQLPPEVLARRRLIADNLLAQVAPLSAKLKQMAPEERRAVFLKLQHDRPIPLTGTGLRQISEPDAFVTHAIPIQDGLDKLERKIDEFATGPSKRGHAPHERLVAPLAEIGFGAPFDRLSEGMQAVFQNLIRRRLVVYEVEIMSFSQGPKQKRNDLQRTRQTLEVLLRARGYENQVFEHEEIKGTARLVVRTTGAVLRELVESPDWQTSIRWFDLKPEFETFHSTLKNFDVRSLAQFEIPDPQAETICIIDSGVSSANPFVAPILQTGSLRSFLRSAPHVVADEYGHGTGVAALASYGAINIAEGAINRGATRIASARILDHSNSVEEDRLFSVVLREAVQSFVQSGVRIFNLSVNNRLQRWGKEGKHIIPRRSWVARTIDKLTREYDVLFVVSTGNLSTEQVAELSSVDQYPRYFAKDEARILDPAQSALALTVGSIVPSTLAVNPLNVTAMAVAEKEYPSPFTRVGPGIRQEIKPEVVDYGGNYHYDPNGPRVFTDPGSNVMTASNKSHPALIHASGTSFSAPRVSRKLALICSGLKQFGVSRPSVALMKAFGVNSAEYPDADILKRLEEALPKKQFLNVTGYGVVNPDRALYGDRHTALMFYQGTISRDSVLFFDVPVPQTLSASKGRKRMTVTVAYVPDVQRWGLEEYLGTRLKWKMFRGDVPREDVIGEMSDEGEEAEGEKLGALYFELGVTLRSKGTVQHDWFEWTQHRDVFSSQNYTLAISSFERWGRASPEPVPVGIVVRIEDLGRSASVYVETEKALVLLGAETRIEV
jgi:hypothetical protein